MNRWFCVLFLNLLFVVSVFGVQSNATRLEPVKTEGPVEDYTSGKNTMIAIMSDADLGVAAYNRKHVHVAKTLNLTHDLNIAAIAQFFPCKTVIGQTFLEESLKCPVNSTDTNTIIARRQQAIKCLIEHPEIKKEIETLLGEAREQEQEVVKLMSDFFIGQTCPEIKQLKQFQEQHDTINYAVLKWFNLNPVGRYFSFYTGISSVFGFAAAALIKGHHAYYGAKDPKRIRNAWNSAWFSTLVLFNLGAIYTDCMSAADKREKLYALNRMVKNAQKVEQLCREYGIANQFNVSAAIDSRGTTLLDGLNHPRYRKKHMRFFQYPAVHLFLYDVYERQKYLAGIFACLAEIDAYNAIATRMLEARGSQDEFCFVRFIDSAKPAVYANGFWNVLVSHAVPNDLVENHHIILTGPNAGGKTTAIRSILQNIVFGQTFGVAAAKTFEFTPFDVIHSYLNVSDDLIHGDSLFVSEVKRAKGILQSIKELQPGKKFFFALDELFTGTVAEDGETCAYEFVKKIASFGGVQFIYATHFGRLKELGANNPACINYKVDAPRKLADGTLVYPYTMSQGANESRVAIDIAKQAKLFD